VPKRCCEILQWTLKVLSISVDLIRWENRSFSRGLSPTYLRGFPCEGVPLLHGKGTAWLFRGSPLQVRGQLWILPFPPLQQQDSAHDTKQNHKNTFVNTWSFKTVGSICVAPLHYRHGEGQYWLGLMDLNYGLWYISLQLEGTRCRSGWGTELQTGWSRDRFPMVSLKFFIDIILPAALWSWGRLSL
jgi:hypothetical protein